ncbi:MAG: pyridoxal phosphate-dependent aminotransferase [Candidatus Acetothermia bacterium]
MSANLSSTIADMEPSPTLKVKEQAAALEEQGRSVLDLSVGDPDFDTPAHVKEAAREALENGFTHYTSASGISELKRAISDRYYREYGVRYDLDQIIVSVGAKQSLYNLMVVLLNPGDRVLVPVPYWVSYPPQIQMAGGEMRTVETKIGDHLVPQMDHLQKKTGERSKAIILNTPNNPTSLTIGASDLERVYSFALEHDMVLISDECYDKLVYGQDYTSAASLPMENKVIINSLSKTFAMTGWRIGYALGPTKIIQAMGRLQSHSTSNPCSIAQKAAVSALNGPSETTEEMVSKFEKRKDYLLSTLESVPGFDPVPPSAAFYLWINVSQHLRGSNSNSTAFCADLLQNTGVALVPGAAFGQESYLRLAYCASRDKLGEAVERITEYCNNL